MDLKLLLIVSTMSAVIGSCFGITVTAKHYRAEIAQLQTEAIKADQEATVKQLNREHYWQEQQRQADKEANNELQKIQDKYDKALSMLNNRKFSNSMHSDSGSSNRTTLSTNTTSTREAKATCECRQLRQDRRTLAEYALKLSAKCDEIAVERNELSKRYQSLTE